MKKRTPTRTGAIQSDLLVGIFVVVLFMIAGWLLWKLGAWQQPDMPEGWKKRP